MTTNAEGYKTIDKFDRAMGSLADLPDVASSRPSTIIAVIPMIGATQTLIIQTFRQRERGDTIFLQVIDDAGSVRLVIPPEAADAIARQRDALTSKIRRRIGKEQAEARKARGELPGFMKAGKGKRKKGGKS